MGNKPNPPDQKAGIPAAQDVSNIQQGYNVGAQYGSNYNQSNPFGTLRYVQTGTGPGGVPQYTALTDFSPEQQALYGFNLASKGIGGAEAGALLGTAGYGLNGSPADVIGNSASGYVGDVMNNELKFMKPFMETNRTQLDAQLKNQGLTPGNPAYDNAMRQLDTANNMSVAKLIGDTTKQGYDIGTNMYQLPAMLAMALGNYGGPTNPATMYGQTNPLQPPNMIGAYSSAQDAAMKAYQAQLQSYNAGLSGMFGIPTAIAGGLAQNPVAAPAIGSWIASTF